jgi:hypothetical protein
MSTEQEVKLEKSALCKWLKADHGCGLKPTEPTEIECIICLSTGSREVSQATMALAGGFQTDLMHAQNFIKLGSEAVRLQDALSNMLQMNHPEEWKKLSEKTAKLAAGGGEN